MPTSVPPDSAEHCHTLSRGVIPMPELIRKNALMHLETLRALDDMEALERLAAAFRERTGRWPLFFPEMIAAGLLQGVPVDPQQHPYQLQPDGKITLHPNSEVKLDYGPVPKPK